MLTTTTSITVACPRPGLALLTLGGEVDIAALEQLDAVLTEAGACLEVVVEASAVEFIDCAALRPLLVAARAAAAGGGCLVLHDPSPALARLIAWCHLGKDLPAEAARTLRRRAGGGGAAMRSRYRRAALAGAVVLEVAERARPWRCTGRRGRLPWPPRWPTWPSSTR